MEAKQIVLKESQNPVSRFYRGVFPLDITQYVLPDYFLWYEHFRGMPTETIDLSPMAPASRWAKIRTDSTGRLFLMTTDKVVIKATPEADMKFEVMPTDTVLTETGPRSEDRETRYRNNDQVFQVVEERLYVFTPAENRVYSQASDRGHRGYYGDLRSPYEGQDIVVDPHGRFYYAEKNMLLNVVVLDQQMKRLASYRYLAGVEVYCPFLAVDQEGYLILASRNSQIYIINTQNFSLETTTWKIVRSFNLAIPIQSLTVNPRTKQLIVLSEGHLITIS